MSRSHRHGSGHIEETRLNCRLYFPVRFTLTTRLHSPSKELTVKAKQSRFPVMKSFRAVLQVALFTPLPLMHAQPNQRVTVDVVVEDKLGHPVRGLQAADFALTDNGQPRTIGNFREVDPDSSTNPTRIVIVLDTINTGFDAIGREREQLGEFLKEDGGKLGYPTSIAVMAESGLKMMKGSTTDGHALLDTVNKFQTELRSVGRSAGFYGAAERLQMSLTQLGELGAYESNQPGRKLVLVISPGWALFTGAGIEEDNKQRAWVYNTIARLTNGLREAHIALYSLNPFELGRTDPFYYQSFLKGVSKPSQAEYPYLGLQVLAEHSGGRALTSGRDILGEINTAVRDAGAYYELSFDPPASEQPNQYHELRIKSDKPDTTARTNASYYAPSGASVGDAASPVK
jgi:VWFA-related protein